MNIEEFYDQDDRRRQSEEVEYGIGWSDAGDLDHSYDLFWVIDTGELYSMRRPPVKEWERFTQSGVDKELDEEMVVKVLATIPERSDVDAALEGWEQHYNTRDSMAWARERLAG